MIRLEQIRRTFGAFRLSVSLAVEAADYMVILGPSGCGKTLLLGIVAGLYDPEQGTVQIEGENVTHAAPDKRRLGYVFQQLSLFPHLTILGNIEFGLRQQHMKREAREVRVAELVEVLGLGPILNRPVSALSGGEAQRVAIARALAPKPRVLLLDEPFSSLDHNARLELQDELRRIQAHLGITTLHVTHNRDEARALGKHCAVMLGGRIVQSGTIDDVFKHPRCLFVQRFLGLDGAVPPSKIHCSEICLGGTGQCDQVGEDETA